MMTQNHLLAGYIISKAVPNPVIGIPLAFLSHFALDVIPHPTEEMEVKFQSSLSTKRDKVTLAFMSSFGILISGVFLILVLMKGISTYSILCMIAANLIDLWTQFLPLVRGKRLKIKTDHLAQPIKNPYINLSIHQLLTLLGFAYLLLS